MKKYLTRLNIVFACELVLFVLIVAGVLPRAVVPYFAVALALYVLISPIEEAVLFFVRSIPLFVAIPITAEFDSLNTWRILAILIFIRWLLETDTRKMLKEQLAQMLKHHRKWHREHPAITALLTLGILAVVSLAVAPDIRSGVTRIIYYANLSLVGIVVYDLASKEKDFISRVIRNITISAMIVIAAGFVQVASTYFIDIYQFMRIWGEGIQLRQFGALWSQIAVHLGNTWFAYYGNQLSLRVFSLFPDSHSFPIFVFLCLPALFAVALDKLISSPAVSKLGKLLRTRARLSVVWVPLALLIAILSGTRGIWAASIGVLLWAFAVVLWMRRKSVDSKKQNVFRYLSAYLAMFFLLFAVAYPIFTSPQFLLSKGDWALFGNRLKSIIDFGETSNSQRLEIWRKSAESIARHPLIGVGIGNFPVVLGQNVFLARAGSSAHNVYLHIAAELGLPALAIALYLLWLLISRTHKVFLSEDDPLRTIYYGAALIYIPWVMLYSLTDVAVFDERAFLLLVTTAALIFAGSKNG